MNDSITRIRPLDTGCPQEENNDMRKSTFAPDSNSRIGRRAHFCHLMVLAISIYFCSGFALWAQTSDSQANTNQSWTTTSESQSDNVNPSRTTQSHTQNGNRTVDKESIEFRGVDGHFAPYQDTEKETVKVDATTVRTITRSFARDANGEKTLVQVTEEEKHTLPGGDSSLVRSVSNPDVNGNLQLVQRQVEDTKKLSKDVEETKTTVMLPSVNGGMAPAMKTQERRTRGANDTVESQKTTLVPDGAGNWQVDEVKRAKISQDGKNRSIEERVSRPDSDGKLTDISRTVTKESEGAAGEKRRDNGNLFAGRSGIGSRWQSAHRRARNHRPAHGLRRSANYRTTTGAA